MSSTDRRQQKISSLRSEALALARAGKHAAAVDRFSKLESLQENEADWPRRAAESLQALGKEAERLSALGRAADCYVRAGMLVKAMAVCRLMLASDPRHPTALNWMSQLQKPLDTPDPSRSPVIAPRTVAARAAAVSKPEPAAARAAAVSKPEPALARTAGAGKPEPTATQKLVATRGLVAVARQVASRSDIKCRSPPQQNAPAHRPEPKLRSAPPPSSSDWQTVDDFELVEADGAVMLVDDSELLEGEVSAISLHAPERLDTEIPVGPLPSLPPLSVDPEQLRTLVPGSIALPSGNGKPSGMFRLAIDGEQVARADEASRQVREVLPKIPLFSELHPKALEGLVRHSRLLSLKQGERVFKQGDAPDSLYVVVSGQVEVLDEAVSRVALYRLGENEFFGESGLISNEAQSVTVEACEDSDLLVFEREAMRSCIVDNPAVVPVLLRFLRERMIEHLMHVSPLFTAFDRAERMALTRRFEFIEFGQGSQLIRQGARSPGLFVLLSGAVEVVRKEAARSHELATLERGGIFGEMSLLGRPAAVADVRGTRAGFTLMLPLASFREIIMTHPQFLEVVNSFSEERREANARLLGATA